MCVFEVTARCDPIANGRGATYPRWAGRSNVSKNDEWMTRLIEDPSHRQRELGNASRLEAVFSFLAVLFAVTAIWGFTSSASVTEWLRPDAIGGLAVLCFAACMAIAANGGIRKRFIALVIAFDAQTHR